MMKNANKSNEATKPSSSSVVEEKEHDDNVNESSSSQQQRPQERDLELYETILSTMIMNLWVKLHVNDDEHIHDGDDNNHHTDGVLPSCQTLQDIIRNRIGREHPYLNMVIENGKFVNIIAKKKKTKKKDNEIPGPSNEEDDSKTRSGTSGKVNIAKMENEDEDKDMFVTKFRQRCKKETETTPSTGTNDVTSSSTSTSCCCCITRDEFIEFGRYPHDFSKSILYIEIASNGFMIKLCHAAADARFLLHVAHLILLHHVTNSATTITTTTNRSSGSSIQQRPFRNVMGNLKVEGIQVAYESFSSPTTTSISRSHPLYWLVNNQNDNENDTPQYSMVPPPPTSQNSSGSSSSSSSGESSMTNSEDTSGVVPPPHIRPRFGRLDPILVDKLKHNVKSRKLSFQAVLNVAVCVAILKSHHYSESNYNHNEMTSASTTTTAHVETEDLPANKKRRHTSLSDDTGTGNSSSSSDYNNLVVLLNAYSMQQDMTTMKIEHDECIPGGAAVWIPIHIREEYDIMNLVQIGANATASPAGGDAETVPPSTNAATTALLWELIQQAHDTFQQQITKNCGQYHMFACMKHGMAAPKSTMFCTNVGKSRIQGSYEYHTSTSSEVSESSLPLQAPRSSLQVEDVHFMGGVATKSTQVKSPGLSLHAFVQQNGWNFTLGYTYPFYTDECAQQLLDDVLDCLQVLATSS